MWRSVSSLFQNHWSIQGRGTPMGAHPSSLGPISFILCSFCCKKNEQWVGCPPLELTHPYTILDPPLRMSCINVEIFNRPSWWWSIWHFVQAPIWHFVQVSNGLRSSGCYHSLIKPRRPGGTLTPTHQLISLANLFKQKEKEDVVIPKIAQSE